MTGVSTLGQALRQIENIKTQQTQLSTLSTQLATGKKTQSYSEMNNDVMTSLRSRASYLSLDVYTTNMTKNDTRINLMLTAIEEFQAQSQQFSKTQTALVLEGSHQTGDAIYYDDPATSTIETTIVGNTSSTTDADMRAVIDHANSLFGFLSELLNTKEGDSYLLAGADSQSKPIEDTGTLDAAVSTLITGWKNGTITTDQLLADLTDRTALAGNTNALTDTVIGYSASLSAGNAGDVYTRISDESELKYTALANEEGFRDIIVAMAFLKNADLMPIVDVYPDGVYPGVPTEQGAPGATASEMQENFYRVFEELSRMVSNGIDSIDQTRFRLETVRAQVAETQKAHQDEKALMLSTIAGVEDVDTNEVAVKINVVKTQLEASFQVTALASTLSLVNFL